MKLFSYCHSILTPLSKREAMERVRDALTKDRAMQLSSIRSTENDLYFSVKNSCFLMKDSFIPDVRVHFNESTNHTDVETICSLQRVPRVFFTVLAVLWTAAEILLLWICFSGSLDYNILLLIPVIVIAFLILLTLFGLRLSSRDTLYVVRTALQSEAISD